MLMCPRFSPIYVSTKQKTDICNSFQVVVQTVTHQYQTNHICI